MLWLLLLLLVSRVVAIVDEAQCAKAVKLLREVEATHNLIESILNVTSDSFLGSYPSDNEHVIKIKTDRVRLMKEYEEGKLYKTLLTAITKSCDRAKILISSQESTDPNFFERIYQEA